jgi:hypothetical protein
MEQSGKTVLIVDDSPSIRDELREEFPLASLMALAKKLMEA